MRSHATRQPTEEDQLAFARGAEAATRLLETLESRDLEELFVHARWGGEIKRD